MPRIHTAPPPQNFIIGIFLFMVAVVVSVAPIAIIYRSAGILFTAYLAFSYSGSAFAYMIVLFAPCVGLISGEPDWLVMLPVMLSAGLLAIIGMDYGWRYGALLISPVLHLVPQVFVWQMSQRQLFAVALPWGGDPQEWLQWHGLSAVLGVLLAVVLDRRREKLEQA